MTQATRNRLRIGWSIAWFMIATGCLLLPVLMMVSCASASSEITPAESNATEESVKLIGATSKTSTLEILIGGDEGEVK